MTGGCTQKPMHAFLYYLAKKIPRKKLCLKRLLTRTAVIGSGSNAAGLAVNYLIWAGFSPSLDSYSLSASILNIL